MVKVSAEQIRQAERENRKYPWTLVKIPKEQWNERMKGVNPQPIECWRSREFLVQVYYDGDAVHRLTVCRTSHTGKTWEDMITWDELQALKRQAGYGEFDAVEVFPRDVDVVNVASMRHLFVFTDKRELPFVWRRGKVPAALNPT